MKTRPNLVDLRRAYGNFPAASSRRIVRIDMDSVFASSLAEIRAASGGVEQTG